MILSNRYRIIGLIGRGGMGEIYRADDLKLDQTVALKFLPPELASDPVKLERFHAEVRLARQVTHPSVCRVHDIGDFEGLPFLSMEFVDGEDLRVLLRRIGRLPEDKAIDIARQICAGIAAGHRQGVLHRDLKPANIMLDERGRVRITDFGLAAVAGEIAGEDVKSGTPAYMAPEQLQGREVTAKSDIFALGLVLYEMFTGRRVFEARTLNELSRLHDTPRVSPREVVDRLNPAVEKVILRCLEKDPDLRPESALAVASALPGGDPLAAALEAGETPSPEMVAAAGSKGTIRLWAAILCLVFVALGVSTVIGTSQYSLIHRAPVTRPPDVLADLARRTIADFGDEGSPADRAYGFGEDDDYEKYIQETDSSLGRWDRLSKDPPSVVFFWYRQSPRPLVGLSGARVSYINPPPLVPGMVSLKLSPQGRLIELRMVPREGDEPLQHESEPPWHMAFDKAGLDFSLFHETNRTWVPPVYADTVKAWEGRFDSSSQEQARVEAALFQGRLVYFGLRGPWSPKDAVAGSANTSLQSLGGFLGALLVVIVVGGSLLLARKNIKAGRSDRQGAFRLAAGLFAVNLLSWVLSADHVPNLNGELSIFGRNASYSLAGCGIIWVLYIALEPYLRQRWPHGVISWSRLLAGRFGDPLIARDLLVGCTVGVLVSALLLLQFSLRPMLGAPMPVPVSPDWLMLLGPRFALAEMLSLAFRAVLGGLGFFFMLLLVRMALRRDWIAIAFVFSMGVALNVIGASETGSPLALMVTTMAVVWSTIVFVTLRFGLLTGIVSIFSANFLLLSPVTLDSNDFYFGPFLFAVGCVLGLVVYGFLRAVDKQTGYFETELLR
jgi:serine/threonine protein kinase